MVIGGKERPVHFGMNTWVSYCELRGVSITEMGEELQRIGDGGGSGAELRDLVWAALKSGARRSKQDFEADNYDVGDWMDEVSVDDLTTFLTEMTESMASRMPSDNSGEKKKVTTSQP